MSSTESGEIFGTVVFDATSSTDLDGFTAAGCAPGEYTQGGLKITMKKNRLVISGGGSLDGVPPLGLQR